MKPLIVIILAISQVLINGCQLNTSQKGYIEFSLSGTTTIEHGDWIEIDGLRFTHTNRLDRLNESLFLLPASYTVASEDPQYSQLSEPVPGISIAIVFASLIHSVNRTNPVDNLEHSYTLLNPSLIHLSGKVSVTRTDSLLPVVETSEGYPVQIRAIPFD
jgi:hypothetical protein